MFSSIRSPRFTTLAAFAVLALVALTVSAQSVPPAPAPASPPWIGISMTPVKGLEFCGGSADESGISLKIVEGSPAQQAGLIDEDVLVAIDGESITALPQEKLQTLIKDKVTGKKPGDIMKFEVLRRTVVAETMLNGVPDDTIAPSNIEKKVEALKSGETVKYEALVRSERLDISVTLGERPRAKDPVVDVIRLRPEHTDDYIRLQEKLIAEYGIQDKYDDLLRRLTEDEALGYPLRLEHVWYTHRNPTQLRGVVAEMTDSFVKIGSSEALTYLMFYGMDMIDGQWIGEIIDAGGCSPDEPGSAEKAVGEIRRRLEYAEEKRVFAFDGLTAEEQTFIRENAFALTEKFIKSVYIDEDTPKAEFARFLKVLKLAEKIDYGQFFEMSRMLDAHGTYLSYLSRSFAGCKPLESNPPGVSGSVLYYEETPYGPIIVGGPEANRYDSPAAFIIDMGGNDFYANDSAGPWMAGEKDKQEPRNFAIVYDLWGDDTYAATSDATLGMGFMGLGAIIDAGGNDLYSGQKWSMGCGLFGVGVLADLGGDDRYRGMEYAQGAALFGIGILADYAGNDRYDAPLYAQGFGLTKGFGLLVDAKGDDEYYASGKYQSGYGTTGIYNAWSQGCGTGMRGWASGGIGMLLDFEGKDRYEAGDFSQACGYFFGMGVLRDFGNGNDTYRGSRYGQSAAAHSAVAGFIEDGGDDSYWGAMGALNSGSWDLTCTFFEDKAGDDTYDGGTFFSMAASAHNGYSLFIDAAGDDRYLYGSYGKAGGNDYHGGYSFSMFIDENSANDSYAGGDDNDKIFGWPEYGVLVDCPATVGKLLEDPDKMKAMMKPMETKK